MSRINGSPITNVSVSVDGLKATNDQIRGIRGYFDLALEGIKLLRNEKAASRSRSTGSLPGNSKNSQGSPRVAGLISNSIFSAGVSTS